MKEVHIQIIRAILAYQAMGGRAPTISEIAKLTRYSRVHIYRHVIKLLKMKIIEVSEKKSSTGKTLIAVFNLAPSTLDAVKGDYSLRDMLRQSLLF